MSYNEEEALLAPAGTSALTVILRLEKMLSWVVRSRQRRALAELDARQLSDIGVSPSNARAEAAKPFWR
jgi:uncharacterized protein YjiS (DUF1127 family)